MRNADGDGTSPDVTTSQPVTSLASAAPNQPGVPRATAPGAGPRRAVTAYVVCSTAHRWRGGRGSTAGPYPPRGTINEQGRYSAATARHQKIVRNSWRWQHDYLPGLGGHPCHGWHAHRAYSSAMVAAHLEPQDWPDAWRRARILHDKTRSSHTLHPRTGPGGVWRLPTAKCCSGGNGACYVSVAMVGTVWRAWQRGNAIIPAKPSQGQHAPGRCLR